VCERAAFRTDQRQLTLFRGGKFPNLPIPSS
jgi:hypothetical protein